MPTLDVPQVYQAIKEAIEEGGYEPTQWEEEFLETMERLSVSKRLDRITQSQSDALEQIYDKLG